MMQLKILYVLILTSLLFVLPIHVSAQVVVSEIMYAPNEGVAHEWFEIFNDGESEVDIEDWRFSDGSNHVFEKPPKNGGQGSLTIQSGEYAVVAKEADTFLNTHTGFGSTVIDGSFSLTDTGDTLSSIDGEGVVVDTVSYGENAGAKKNGLSLQLIDGVWTPATPTPGSGTLQTQSQTSSQEQESQTGGSDESSSFASGASSSNDFTVDPQIFAHIIASGGKDRSVTVGADSLFKGEAAGITGDSLKNARFIWNFGDGMRSEGPSVLHYYRYPGEYVVTLEVSSGEYAASDRVAIFAHEVKVVISRGTPEVITLSNLDEYELDLSWWYIAVGETSFMLPQHTVILPQHEIHLSSEITDLHPKNNKEVSLRYPNGETVVQYSSEYKKPLFENTPMRSGSPTYSGGSIVGAEVPVVYNTTKGDEGSVTVEKGVHDNSIQQVAAVSESLKNKKGNKFASWSALVGIVAFGSVSALVLRRRSLNEITIIE